MKAFLKNLIPHWIKKSLSYEEGDDYSFKSYSQEGEDALLNRIFGSKADGFYIDVGAHHPHRFSNTYALYKRGWSGICIDPNPNISELFKDMRSLDIFLNIGISEMPSELTYYQYKHPAYNTCDESLKNERITVKPLSQTTIETDTLANVLNKHIPNSKNIDLITVDVEGMDFQVLKSNDWNRYVPKWILIEIYNIQLENLENNDIYVYLKKKNYSLECKLFNTCLFKLNT